MAAARQDKQVSLEFRDALPKPFESLHDPLSELNVRSEEVIDEIRDNKGLGTPDLQTEVPIFEIGSHLVEEHALFTLKIRKSVISLIPMFGGIDLIARLLTDAPPSRLRRRVRHAEPRGAPLRGRG